MLGVHDCAVIYIAHCQFWISFFFILMQREKEQQEEKSGLFRNMGRNEDGERRAMITPALREALTKQGENLQELLLYDYGLRHSNVIPRMKSLSS